MYVKRGNLAGAATEASNKRRAAVGQMGDPGIQGTGTVSAVSLACRVLVRVTMTRAPELAKVMLPLDNV